MINKVSLTAALTSLNASGSEFKKLFEHGTLSVELYKPETIDKQTPHERDEVYIIASGAGKFILEDEITNIQAGDFLFVPARAAHKFIDFTSDFCTWVLFYGAAGGETGIAINSVS